jgi:hypothetical protein
MQVRHLGKLIMPSRHNAYRAHLLRRSSLVFFLALILLSEASLVGAQFHAIGTNPSLAAVAASPAPSLTSQVLKRVSAVLGSQRDIDWFLGAVAGILLVLCAFSFFFRPQVQPTHLIGPAIVLVVLALLLIALNTAVL